MKHGGQLSGRWVSERRGLANDMEPVGSMMSLVAGSKASKDAALAVISLSAQTELVVATRATERPHDSFMLLASRL